ncbi:hypothetical protein AB0B39_23670 [Micromonospora sp. NPDC049114]|uniref:hypothetical protein n=1 Tax=Micromonospora sp. NPDC049114 TaxID=3155498 RepID=UPI0033C7DD80
MTDVFDLDAYVAEHRKVPYRFRYGGQDFALPHAQDTDWRVMEVADQGDVEAIQTLFRRGLGPEQWERFDELPQPAGAMGELFRRWQAHSGTKPGESPASPGSSESTAGPSTRRSAGTTRARRSVKP